MPPNEQADGQLQWPHAVVAGFILSFPEWIAAKMMSNILEGLKAKAERVEKERLEKRK